MVHFKRANTLACGCLPLKYQKTKNFTAMRIQHRFADFNHLGLMLVEMFRGKRKRSHSI